MHIKAWLIVGLIGALKIPTIVENGGSTLGAKGENCRLRRKWPFSTRQFTMNTDRLMMKPVWDAYHIVVNCWLKQRIETPHHR
jgi:hypothetical protein